MDIKIFNTLKVIFDEGYTKADLEKAFKSIGRNFIKENIRFLVQQKISRHLIELADRKSFVKDQLTSLAALLFCTKEIFQKFHDYLPSEASEVMDFLIWREKSTQEEIKTELGVDFTETTERRLYGGGIQQVSGIKPAFAFFNVRSRNYWSYYQNSSDFIIWLPLPLRMIISDYYELPSEARLLPIPQPTATKHLYLSGEKLIFTELPRIIAYAKQGQIKETSKGFPMASTLNKMQRKLNITEFFPNTKDKVLKNIRTNLLASLIITLSKGQQSKLDLPSLIRDHIFLKNFRHEFFSLPVIHTELKGTGYLDFQPKGIEHRYLEFLKFLPLGWINFENFENNLRFNFYDTHPVSEYIAREKLYFSINRARGYKEKSYIGSENYHTMITLPYMKGVLFLFAAFGLLDIAYDDPDTSVIGETAFSAYDGLKAIRLTELGRYVLGKNLTYDSSEVIEEHKIILSEDALILTTEENDDTADIILEPYTEKVGPNRYRTDNSFFLNGCRSKSDLQSKIGLFKQSIKTELPDNWRTFFKQLESKIDPLSSVEGYKIFQIPADDRDLIRLIARDAQLKTLVFKAENYMLLIPSKNIGKFKKRLQEFGYLMTV